MDVERLIASGESLELEGRFEEAASAYEQALELGMARVPPASRLRTLRRIARLRRARGDVEGAAELYQQALDLAFQLGDAAEIAVAATGMGNVSGDQGRWTEAQDFYRAGLKHASPLGEPLQIGQLWNNLSMVRRRLGDLDGALDASARSIEMLEKVGDRNELARAYNHLALVQVERDTHEAALNSYTHAASLADDASVLGAVHANLCDLWRRIHQARVEQSASRFDGEPSWTAGTGSWAGLDGSQQAELGADLARSSGFPLLLAHIHMEQGALCRLRRDPAGAELFEQALEIVRRHDYRHVEGEVRVEYGLYLRDMGQPEAAARHLRTARDIYDAAGARREAARVEDLLRELESGSAAR
jgi:tetratricopeptide (TPR) repeat protein